MSRTYCTLPLDVTTKRESRGGNIDRNILLDSRNTAVVELSAKVLLSKRYTCGKEQNLPHSHSGRPFSLTHHHRYLIIMPNNPMIKVARTFQKKLNSLFHTSGPPTPLSPTDMGSRSDNNMTATHAGAR